MKGISLDVDKFANITDVDGWPVKGLELGNGEEYGYHFTIDSINDMMVTIQIAESTLENMLNEIRARWPLESR